MVKRDYNMFRIFMNGIGKKEDLFLSLHI